MVNVSDSRTSFKLYIFILVLNLVFPVLGYTFTTFGGDIAEYEIGLDPDMLAMAGITLADAETHNITYNGGWVTFTEINTTIRATFMDAIYNPWYTLIGDGMTFEKQTSIGRALDLWGGWYSYKMDVKSLNTNEWTKILSNETIVRDWDIDYNWSRFILADGHNIFITPYDTHGNITRGVYVDAHLNCTIAMTFGTDTNMNFWQFIGWYASIMVGSNSWGLPSMFSWLIRVLGALSVFAIVMLTKELIRIL